MIENMHGKSEEIMGIKFYGLSWSILYGQWAYMLPERELANQWSNIPSDTDVLVTHGPPYGLLYQNGHGNPCGSESLREKVMEIKPKLHCFGHIHESHSYDKIGQTWFVNAAICDGLYDPINKPIVVEIENGEILRVSAS
jgi:Icc-related predicted phosphoesterase